MEECPKCGAIRDDEQSDNRSIRYACGSHLMLKNTMAYNAGEFREDRRCLRNQLTAKGAEIALLRKALVDILDLEWETASHKNPSDRDERLKAAYNILNGESNE